MKLEIIIGEEILQGFFKPTVGNARRQTMNNRLERHILVGSKELMREWNSILDTADFQKNPLLREQYEYWIADKVTDKANYKSVKLPETSNAQGNPSAKEQVILATAYESTSKIVVGDYRDDLRRANPDLRFVNEEGFSQPSPTSLTMKQVETVLDGASNLKKDLFVIFETPLELVVDENASADLLSRYLALFYDEHRMVIQDKFFVRNKRNEENFKSYVLPYVDKTKCEIQLRVMVNRDCERAGQAIKRRYEGMQDHMIKVKCIWEHKENLHESYIETSTYRIRLGYRLAIFGKNGRTQGEVISIRKK